MAASQLFSGNGDPNGVVNANPGDLYQDQSVPGELWLKETGAGTNTGWISLGSGGTLAVVFDDSVPGTNSNIRENRAANQSPIDNTKSQITNLGSQDGTIDPSAAGTTATGSTIGGGNDNTASGNYSTVPGGSGNVASGANSFATGNFSNASREGQRSHASGSDLSGAAQRSDIVMRATTPGIAVGESVELGFGTSGSQVLQLEDVKGYSIVVWAIARGEIGGVANVQSFKRTYAVRKTSGVTTIAAMGAQEQLGDAASADWTLLASVAAAPDRFAITFTTGSTQSKVRVVASVDFVETIGGEEEVAVLSATQIPPKFNDPAYEPTVLGGDMITINGVAFTGATSVTVNGISTPFVVNSDNEILLGPVPAAQPFGPATVIVTIPAGSSAPATPFIYSHWRTLAPVGVAGGDLLRNDGYSLLLDNGKILYFGGTGIGGPFAACPVETYLFDPTTYTWAATGNLINGRECFAAVKHSNGKVYVFGGSTNQGDAPFGVPAIKTEIYDPGAGTWSAGGDLNIPRGVAGPGVGRVSFCAIELLDGNILVFGGSDTTQNSEIYNTTTDLSGNQAAIPLVGGPTDTFLDTTGIRIAGGDIIAWGGHDTATAVAGATYRYDAAGNSWSVKTAMPTPRSGNDMKIALLPSGKIITVGGATAPFNLTPGNRPVTDVVEIYDPVGDSWATGSSINEAATGVQLSVLADGTLQRSGGVSGVFTYSFNVLTTEQYDEGSDTWTAKNPRQMNNTPGWWFYTALPGFASMITGGGAWDHNMVVVTPVTDVIFVVGQYPIGSGVEQYRPLPL